MSVFTIVILGIGSVFFIIALTVFLFLRFQLFKDEGELAGELFVKHKDENDQNSEC